MLATDEEALLITTPGKPRYDQLYVLGELLAEAVKFFGLAGCEQTNAGPCIEFIKGGSCALAT